MYTLVNVSRIPILKNEIFRCQNYSLMPILKYFKPLSKTDKHQSIEFNLALCFFFSLFGGAGWGYFILFFTLVRLFVLFQFILNDLAHNLYWFKFTLTWRDLCKVSVNSMIINCLPCLSLSLSLASNTYYYMAFYISYPLSA